MYLWRWTRPFEIKWAVSRRIVLKSQTSLFSHHHEFKNLWTSFRHCRIFFMSSLVCQLQRMVAVDMHGVRFKKKLVLMLCVHYHRRNIMVSTPCWNFFDIFLITLQKHFRNESQAFQVGNLNTAMSSFSWQHGIWENMRTQKWLLAGNFCARWVIHKNSF